MSCFQYVSEGPGPGAYNVPSTITVKRPSSRPQSTGNRGNRIVGTSMTVSAASLGVSRLHKRVPTNMAGSTHAGDTTPGPGAYNSTGLELKSKGPSFSIGSSVCLSQSGMRNTVRSTSRSGIQSSMYQSTIGAHTTSRSCITHDAIITEPVPGPGSYDVKMSYVTSASPSYSFGARLKTPKQKASTSTPGPGAYNPRPQSSGPSFSLSGRSPTRKPRSDSPGPGTYNVQLKASGPSFSMSGVRSPVRIPQADVPGPGAYTCRSSSNGPSFTMRSRSPIKQYVI